MFGYCTATNERIVVYELLDNKSLDQFIYGENAELDWNQRVHIMQGICRALSYLENRHIVHLDIKPHNILLDSYMNPKVADFGTAKVLQTEEYHLSENEQLTGTERYMSPEYKRERKFSTKSDVFSFGVLLLEMLTGRKNTLFDHQNRTQNLVGHAWDTCVDNPMLSLKDPKLGDTCTEEQFTRIFMIALHCVQAEARYRPLASELVDMLSSDGVVAELVLPSYISRNEGLASTSAPMCGIEELASSGTQAELEVFTFSQM